MQQIIWIFSSYLKKSKGMVRIRKVTTIGIVDTQRQLSDCLFIVIWAIVYGMADHERYMWGNTPSKLLFSILKAYTVPSNFSISLIWSTFLSVKAILFVSPLNSASLEQKSGIILQESWVSQKFIQAISVIAQIACVIICTHNFVK